jgi:hypothetical protein
MPPGWYVVAPMADPECDKYRIADRAGHVDAARDWCLNL